MEPSAHPIDTVHFSPFVPRAFCTVEGRTDSVNEIEIYRGMPLFSDISDVVCILPEGLKGLQYIRAPFSGTTARCVIPGMAYILTPPPGESLLSLGGWLAENGFCRNDLKPFQLTNHDGMPYRVAVYQKLLAENETIAFGISGVLIF